MADIGILSGNPVVLVGIVIGVIVLIIFAIKKKAAGGTDYREFIPIPFTKTISDSLKEKFELVGQKYKGKLYLGAFHIADIVKMVEAKGKFSNAVFDHKSKNIFTEEGKDVEYNLVFLMCGSDNVFFRIFGVKKRFFILKKQDQKGKDIVTFDVDRKRVFLTPGMDLKSYGDVWHNSAHGIEYVNDISTMRLLEVIMMHLENNPDKVAHMEQQQAKLERSARVYSDLERGKWDDRKNVGDTTIS